MCGSKLGKILGLKIESIDKSFDWFYSKGKYAVFFGRFIPIVRSLVSIPAGMSKMPMTPFLVLTTIGSVIWNTVLVILGKIAGDSWTKIVIYVGDYSDLVLLGFVIIFILGIISSYTKRKRKYLVIGLKKRT